MSDPQLARLEQLGGGIVDPPIDEPRPTACHCGRQPTVVTSLLSSRKFDGGGATGGVKSHGSDGRAMALRFLTKRAV
nr:hypothetical protein Iba_chr02bCG13720 [Ipomoea batatas]